MSTTPEQMQAMYAQMQRQRMEQQWAAMQGAYSGVPGAPVQAPGPQEWNPQQAMQQAQQAWQAQVAQQQPRPQEWNPQMQAQAPAPLPNYGMTGQYAATGGFPPGHPMALPAAGGAAPQMMIEPWQGGAAAVRGGVVPAPPAAEPMMTTQDMVTMPDGRVLNRQQAIAAGYQQPVRGADMAQQQQEWQRQVQASKQMQPQQNWTDERYVPSTRPAIQPGTSNEQMDMNQMRQQMEQKWAQQQGAFTGQRGAPSPVWGGRQPGLINKMNAREEGGGDPYAGQNLTADQRQTATANEQAVQKYRAGQNPAATPVAPMLPGAQEQKQYAGGGPALAGAQEQITPKGQQQTFGGPAIPEFMPDQYKAQLGEQQKQQKQLYSEQLATPKV